jgi:acetolactate synthase-1/2/3 large subunit
MDSIPLVIISGQVPTPAIGLDAFQEVDTVGITRPCVKHNFLVKDVKDLALTIKKAFYIARTGRPGPVLVDIPKDVQQAKTQFHYPEQISLRLCQPGGESHAGQIKKAIQLLIQAKRLMICTGGGVILRGFAELAELVRVGISHQHADGAGRLPGHRSAVPGHARDARHLREQHGDAALRRAARGRRQVR